jgi:cobalt-zinc-cadmium resistance protein CzcA
MQSEENKMESFLVQKKEELNKYNDAIQYFSLYGDKLAKEIIKVAQMSYKQGEIDFFQYITSLENATSIQVDYLEAVLQFNKIQNEIIYLNY